MRLTITFALEVAFGYLPGYDIAERLYKTRMREFLREPKPGK